MMQRLVLSFAILMHVGCATSLKMTSSPPEVTVFEGEQKIGVTPLEITSDKMKTKVANGYLLRLEREGFHKVWVWVPDGIRGLNLVVNLQPFIKVEDIAKNKAMSRSEIDGVSARVLSMQKDLLLKGVVPDDVVAALVTQYPQVGAAHYLAALNLLRKGSKPEATEEAKKAILLSPSEPDYVVLYRELGGDPAAIESNSQPVPEADAAPTKEVSP